MSRKKKRRARPGPSKEEQAPRATSSPSEAVSAKQPSKAQASDAAPSWRLLALALLGCLALSFAAYGNSLGGKYVFDDERWLVQTDCHDGLARIPAMFSPKARWTICKARPVRSASFAIDYAIWGRGPFGHHVTNVLLHGLTAFVLALLIIRLGGSRRLAALAAALFVLHPIATESVAYISGRRDLLMGLFALLATYHYVGFLERGGLWRAIATPLCFGLAVGSHELAAALPVPLLLLQLARGYQRDPSLSPRQALASLLTRRTIPVVVLLGLVLLAVIWKRNFTYREELWGPDLGAHIGTVLRVHAYYLKQLVLPIELIADYSANTFRTSTTLFEAAALGAVALVGGLLGLCCWRWRRAPVAAAAGLSYFVLLLPVSHIFVHHELLAEHRLYLPSACFCALLALALDRGLARWGQPVWAIAAGLALAGLVLTTQRNEVWRDSFTLWTKTVSQAPDNGRALGNLGIQYLNRGDDERARELLERSLAIQSYCETRVSLGSVLVRLGEAERGIALLKTGKCMARGRHHYLLGRAYSRLRRWAEAERSLRKAIRRAPPAAELRWRLGFAIYRQQRPREALAEYTRAIALNPKLHAARFGIGLIHAHACEQAQARRVLSELMRLVPPKSRLFRGATMALEGMQRKCAGELKGASP